MRDITIMTTSSKEYIEYFYVFLKSAAINFPQAKIYAVLVNVPKFSKIEEVMKNANPNLHIKYEKKEFSLEYSDLEYAEAIYCCNRRALMFKEALEMYKNDIVLYADADSIFRRDCTELVQHLNNCDLTLIPKTVSGPPWKEFAGGVIGMDPNKMKPFILEYEQMVYNDTNEPAPLCSATTSLYHKAAATTTAAADPRPSEPFSHKKWFSNQTRLRDCYFKFKDSINFKPLPSKFCDWNFVYDGVIWCAKRSGQEDNQYKKLHNFYYNMIEGLEQK
tara:strand:- start:382 stop:1209 length:828 start_codon:yes stop_codon:yes gene_type:complete